jgi:hypothetical protein
MVESRHNHESNTDPPGHELTTLTTEPALLTESMLKQKVFIHYGNIIAVFHNDKTLHTG